HTRGMPLQATLYEDIFLNVYKQELAKRKDDEAAKAIVAKLDQFRIGDIINLINKYDREHNIFASQDPAAAILEKAKKSEHYPQMQELAALDKDFAIFQKVQEKSLERDLEEIADVTHGFVGADLAALSKE